MYVGGGGSIQIVSLHELQLSFIFGLQPFKLIAMGFNWILGQIAWTIIRFEIHHLWNPDWTYAFPQQSFQQNQQSVMDNAMYYAQGDELPVQQGNNGMMEGANGEEDDFQYPTTGDEDYESDVCCFPYLFYKQLDNTHIVDRLCDM